MLDDGQVVGDEQIRQAEFFLQVLQQVDDLRLNGHVQRRHRLVADDEIGVDRKRPSDADALPLTAAELVRIAAERGTALKPDDVQQLLHPLLPLRAVGQAVNEQRLADDVADGHPRIERRIRVLENNLHFLRRSARICWRFNSQDVLTFEAAPRPPSPPASAK